MTNGKIKKSPQRMCIACRQMFDKKQLLRIVKSPAGEVSIDLTGKKDGRGAYVCSSYKCADKCAKGLLHKHLGCEIPTAIFEEIRSINRAKGQD